MSMRVRIRAVGMGIAGAIAVLVAIHLVLRLVSLPDLPGDIFVRNFVDFNDESSVTTWLSAVLWLSAAGVAACVGVVRGRAGDARGRRWWMAFTLVPLAISIDEVAAVHETTSEHVRALLSVDGVLYYAWVIPVGLIALVLAAVFFRFWWGMPAWLRARVALAAVLAAGGALGLELVGAGLVRSDEAATGSAAHVLVTTAEETLEMTGALVLLLALLSHVAGRAPEIVIGLRGEGRTREPSRGGAFESAAGAPDPGD